jgi:hypothetical protein
MRLESHPLASLKQPHHPTAIKQFSPLVAHKQSHALSCSQAVTSAEWPSSKRRRNCRRCPMPRAAPLPASNASDAISGRRACAHAAQAQARAAHRCLTFSKKLSCVARMELLSSSSARRVSPASQPPLIRHAGSRRSARSLRWRALAGPWGLRCEAACCQPDPRIHHIGLASPGAGSTHTPPCTNLAPHSQLRPDARCLPAGRS